MPVDNKTYSNFEELSPEEQEEFLKTAESTGCREAVDTYIKGFDTTYIFDEKRGDWSFLLMLDKEKSIVLDAGSGWGAIAFSLSSRCKRIVAMDFFEGKGRFVKIRAQQENRNNINSLTGDVEKLPFADNSFDLVILNGVLEWTGLLATTRSPLLIHQEVLKEAYRVLKKEGYLYLAIENRFAATLLLGYRDEHTRLRFVTLLPRKIANIYSNVLTGKDYRIYTHSLNAYRRMLTEAGFSSLNFYAPIPSYRRFTYLIPLDNSKDILDYFISNIAEPMTPMSYIFMWLTRLSGLSSLHKIFKYFVPDYSIFAKK